ncbi:MAG TPA: glycosyltransferase family 39 protein [Candidatus Dormibacteraeota bacterium]|nr:glycosyltransferase family 39 protein [Candidatus Dormibacteraeota bacterium]
MAATPSTASAEPAREEASSGPVRRLFVRPAWEILALVAISSLALFLRLYHVDGAPLFTDNLDEIQFTWAGLNLIKHGDPITWSYYPGYPAYEAFKAFGTTVPVVHHWMDHPPLFSLLMGGWVWLLGVRDMTGFTAAQVRVIPVVASTLTVPLVHLLGRRFIGAPAALVGALLLATAPAAVLLGRQAEPESVQAVMLLASLLLTLRAVEGRGGRWTLAALLAIGVTAPLLKVSGIAIPSICAVILAASGRWRLTGALAASGVAGLLLFVLYGALIDWQQFLAIWGVQASNRIGVMSGYDFITAMAGVNRRLRDGWWLLGWIGLGLLLARRGSRRELFLVWPTAAYVVAMLVLAGEKQVEQYGWYRVIVYPELYLAAGWVAWEALSRRSLGLLALLLALGGATATNWWLGGPDAGWVPNPLLLAVLIAAVLGPAVLLLWRRHEVRPARIAGWIAMAAFGLIVLGNVIESLQLDRIFFHM